MRYIRSIKVIKYGFFKETNKVLTNITMNIPVNVSSNLKGKRQRGMK